MNNRANDHPSGERVWERGWEDHSLQQLRRLAKRTMAEKLAWLEEAHRMVRAMNESAKKDR